MSELQFPKDPVVGQEYDFPPYKYYWDGIKWKTKGIGHNPVNDLRDELEPIISDNESKVFEALRRSYADAGLNLVEGSFEEGGKLLTASDVMITASGVGYSWGGPKFPHNVAPGTDPTAVTGYVSRTDVVLRNKLAAAGGAGLIGGIAQPVTSTEFAGGADKTGIVSSVAAFQAAVNQTDGEKIYPALYDSVPQAPWITIHVPEGKYLIDSRVYPDGKNVIWDCDVGVKFLGNVDNLCGKVVMNGARINSNSSGSLDGGAGFAVSINRGLGKPAAIMGIGAPSDLRTVTERDAVGFYAEAESTTPTLTVASATYTATTAIPSTAVDVRDLLAGMIIDVTGGYSGVLESWASDGSSLTVADGWYQVGGPTSPVVPPAAGFVVNQLTKVWALNAQCVMSSGDTAQRSAGFELGLRNSKVNLTDPSDTTAYQWGYDTVAFGPFPASTGFIQRGGFLRGFESSGATKEGFAVTQRGSALPPSAFAVLCDSFEQFVAKPNGTNPAFKVTNAGNMDLGGQSYGTGTLTVRMRSSGLNDDYDVRLQSIGGTVAPAGGTFRVVSAWTEVFGGLRPQNTNSVPCGTASQAWSGGATQAAFTVLSDERYKSEMLAITDQMLDAWAEVDWAQYQFLDRIEAKGEDGARWHFGVSAQRVVEAFTRHGIANPFKYAFLCYDEWEDQFETEQTNIGEFTVEKRIVSEPARGTMPATHADGSPVLDANGHQVMLITTVMTEVEVEVQVPATPVFETRLVTPAGNKYGIRYEEALVLEAALQRRNYQRLLARIEALERS